MDENRYSGAIYLASRGGADAMREQEAGRSSLVGVGGFMGQAVPPDRQIISGSGPICV